MKITTNMTYETHKLIRQKMRPYSQVNYKHKAIFRSKSKAARLAAKNADRSNKKCKRQEVRKIIEEQLSGQYSAINNPMTKPEIEFDLTSFEIELKDLLRKYKTKLKCVNGSLLAVHDNTQYFVGIGDKPTPPIEEEVGAECQYCKSTNTTLMYADYHHDCDDCGECFDVEC